MSCGTRPRGTLPCAPLSARGCRAPCAGARRGAPQTRTNGYGRGPHCHRTPADVCGAPGSSKARVNRGPVPPRAAAAVGSAEPEDEASFFIRNLRSLPWQRAAVWVVVATVAFQLSDFFGVRRHALSPASTGYMAPLGIALFPCAARTSEHCAAHGASALPQTSLHAACRSAWAPSSSPLWGAA